jgi:hypothetical protein
MAVPESEDAVWGEHQAALHDDINRLPRTFRLALILCDLEGCSPWAAAKQLGWPVRRIQRCLARARGSLRAHLARRGVILPESCGIAEFLRVGVGEPVVSRRLIESTVRIATQEGRRAARVPSPDVQ